MTPRDARPLAVAAAAIAATVVAGWFGAPPWAQALAGGAAAVAALAALPAAPARTRPDPVRPDARAGDLPLGIGHAALERLPSALLLVDASGRVMFGNRAARGMLERLRLGEHYSMSFRSPDLLDALGAAMRDGGARELEFTLHSDRNRVIRAHIQPGGDEDGRRRGPTHVLCLLEDRTRDLRAQRMRTDFIANASHELKTPLASIKGFIETLMGPAREDPEAQARFLAIMLAQAERMQRLVDDLLSLNRIELNEHVPPADRLDLHALARDAAAALEPVFRAREAALQVALPETGPAVRGDRDQLLQALSNLLENALKYGRGKPVRIEAADPSPDFPGMTGVAVIDRGEGIERRHIPRLTERFYRVSVKRSRDQGGTGLGLAIVKHILSRHRGDLAIDSAPGEGSRFTLWLPVAPPQPEERRDDPAASGSPEAASGGPLPASGS